MASAPAPDFVWRQSGGRYSPAVAETDTERTFRFERWRAISGGVLESAATTFLLLIAVKHFQAGATAKALLSIGGSLGLLCGPMVVGVVERLRLPAAQAASRLAAAGGVCLLIMAAVPTQAVYITGGMLAMALASAIIPLMTQVYQDNYPEALRGRLFSRALMIRIGAALLFSAAGGWALDKHLDWFRVLLLLFGVAYFFSSWCFSRLPSRPLTPSGSSHPLRAFRYVREDRLFRWTLICWMLMGFANLMMYPLRVEYLANPQYGSKLNVGEVALYVGVVPNLVRFALSPLWGWLFDRMNFFVMRIVLNLGFALGIVSFFVNPDNTTSLLVGAIVFGAANAGGDVAWGLWVTKLAPPDRVADYMSVHTFFTGVRGVAAPLLAFHLVGTTGFGTLAWICGGLIVLSALMLVPEVHSGRALRKSVPLVEEVSE
ncbi:MAG: MFS transporter [Pedosphaera sp.]|nr:MFS transporter [Pedosphaera sp.]MSU43148.1 MFS transporter [Pedosphaera sp.]